VRPYVLIRILCCLALNMRRIQRHDGTLGSSIIRHVGRRVEIPQVRLSGPPPHKRIGELPTYSHCCHHPMPDQLVEALRPYASCDVAPSLIYRLIFVGSRCPAETETPISRIYPGNHSLRPDLPIREHQNRRSRIDRKGSS
jgi:hypothetical protein